MLYRNDLYVNIHGFQVWQYYQILLWSCISYNDATYGLSTWFIYEYDYGWNVLMVLYGFGSTELSVWEYVHDWNMGAACYAFVARATSRVPYFVILIGIGSCVLRLRARATSRVPILLRHGSCVLCLCARATSRVPILIY